LLLWNCVDVPDYAILKVKASPPEGGTASISPPGPEYAEGTRVTLTATKANGYAFTHWDGYLSGTSPIVTVTIIGDKYNEKTATANFVKVYDLMVDNKPTIGGTTTADGTAIHRTGTEVTVTAKHNPGYRFDRWSGASTSTDSTITITMNSDKKLTANYVRIFEFKTKVDPAVGGTMDITIEVKDIFITYTGITAIDTTIDTGAVVNITQTAKSGYRFNGWSGTPSGVNPLDVAITFTMTTDQKSLTANFGRVHELTVDNKPATGGKTTHDGITILRADTSVTVTARPNSGYRFDRWSDASTSTNPTVTITMNNDKKLTANYVKLYVLTVDNDPAAGGTTTHDGADTLDIGTQITITAKPNLEPNPGYRFDKWLRDGVLLSTNPTVTITMNNDTKLTAKYIKLYTLTVNNVPTAGGTTTHDGSNTFDVGTSLTVTATSKTGYKFDRWSGSGASTSTNPTITIIMDGNKTLTAIFVLTPAVGSGMRNVIDD
jgi:uncharacterized repeat protein (TIGR02543 family)